MIENKADINRCDRRGQTALIAAINRGHQDIAVCLIQNKADFNAEHKYGDALRYAIRKTHLQVIAALLERGASLLKMGKDTIAMHQALKKKTVMLPILSFFLSPRPDFSQKLDDVYGQSDRPKKIQEFGKFFPMLRELRQAYFKAVSNWDDWEDWHAPDNDAAKSCVSLLHKILRREHLPARYHAGLFEALKFEVYRIRQWYDVMARLQGPPHLVNLVSDYIGSPLLSANRPEALLTEMDQQKPVFNPAKLVKSGTTKRNNPDQSTTQAKKQARH